MTSDTWHWVILSGGRAQACCLQHTIFNRKRPRFKASHYNRIDRPLLFPSFLFPFSFSQHDAGVGHPGVVLLYHTASGVSQKKVILGMDFSGKVWYVLSRKEVRSMNTTRKKNNRTFEKRWSGFGSAAAGSEPLSCYLGEARSRAVTCALDGYCPPVKGKRSRSGAHQCAIGRKCSVGEVKK